MDLMIASFIDENRSDGSWGAVSKSKQVVLRYLTVEIVEIDWELF